MTSSDHLTACAIYLYLRRMQWRHACPFMHDECVSSSMQTFFFRRGTSLKVKASVQGVSVDVEHSCEPAAWRTYLLSWAFLPVTVDVRDSPLVPASCCSALETVVGPSSLCCPVKRVVVVEATWAMAFFSAMMDRGLPTHDVSILELLRVI